MFLHPVISAIILKTIVLSVIVTRSRVPIYSRLKAYYTVNLIAK